MPLAQGLTGEPCTADSAGPCDDPLLFPRLLAFETSSSLLTISTLKHDVQRSLLVDKPELGYPKGQLEIPPGATFELKVEVLNFTPRSA